MSMISNDDQTEGDNSTTASLKNARNAPERGNLRRWSNDFIPPRWSGVRKYWRSDSSSHGDKP